MFTLLVLAILYIGYLFFNIKTLSLDVLLLSWHFFVLYVIIAIFFLKKYRNVSIFSPELFFFIVFFLETFSYAPLLYNIETANYSLNVLLPKVNDISIIKGQCIALLGFLFYILGAVIVKKNYSSVSNEKGYSIFIFSKNHIHFFTSMLIIISMIWGGYELLNKYTDSTVGLTDASSFFPFLTIFIVISSVVEFLAISKKNIISFVYFFKKVNKLFCLNVFFLSVFFLLSGTRSFAFPLILPVLFLYDRFIKKMKKKYVVLMLITSFFLMLFIKDTRKNIDESVDISMDMLSVGEDFISGNVALFYLVDYTDINGNQGGSNAILQMVSFIPFAQSFFVNVLGITNTPSSSEIFKNNTDTTWGLGTHVIGDLYYTFGWFGVISCMFILGMLTSILYKKVNIDSPKIGILVVYLLLLGNSLMFSRVEFFFLIRNIGFSLIILWLIKKNFSLRRRIL